MSPRRWRRRGWPSIVVTNSERASAHAARLGWRVFCERTQVSESASVDAACRQLSLEGCLPLPADPRRRAARASRRRRGPGRSGRRPRLHGPGPVARRHRHQRDTPVPAGPLPFAFRRAAASSSTPRRRCAPARPPSSSKTRDWPWTWTMPATCAYSCSGLPTPAPTRCCRPWGWQKGSRSVPNGRISIRALGGIPEIVPGDDLCGRSSQPSGFRNGPGRAALADGPGPVFIVAQKAVSKAEGRIVRLDSVVPSARAESLAAELRKDPRMVEIVLRESRRIVRAGHGVLIVETHGGFICANAGVDASNAPEGCVTLLPADPDESARQLQRGLVGRLGDRGRGHRLGHVRPPLAPGVDQRGARRRGPLAFHRLPRPGRLVRPPPQRPPSWR